MQVVKRVSSHINRAVNQCSNTLLYTRNVGYIILITIILMVLNMILDWPESFNYIFMAILTVAGAYLALLISQGDCFIRSV